MSAFTQAEIEYLQRQRLARLATSGLDGQPHVVPVSYRYNAEHDSIDIGGTASPRGGNTDRYSRTPRSQSW